MKQYIFQALAIAAALTCSCSGNVDPEDQGTPASGPAEPYTLTVSKTSVEADGSDAATMRIIDANGLDLTGSEYIRNTSFHIEETDEYISGMTEAEPNVFRSITDGTYTITGMYAGKPCANSVSIQVKNRSKYEVFHKNVAIYRLTGTWCQFCPYMTEALGKVNANTKDHSIVLEFHNDDEYSIAYNATQDLAASLLSRFGTSDAGYPFCIYSLYEGSGKRTVADIQEFVKTQLYANAARTGIKAESSVENGSIKVSATVKASAAGKYDLGIAVLEDNCVPASTSAYESVYNGVVRNITGNFFAMSTEAFELQADGEKLIEKTFSADFLTSETKNYRIVLFTLREAGSKIIIDNAAECQLGSKVEYAYN